MNFRSPSVPKLREVFGDKAAEAKRILRMTRKELIATEAGNARVVECYNPPSTQDIRFHVLNKLAETFGVEAVALGDGTIVEHLNSGDMYTATLYKLNGHYYVGDIGSLIERRESMDLQSALRRSNGW